MLEGQLSMSETKTAGFMSMKGDGYYSKATAGAKDVIDNATPLVMDAINSMNLSEYDGPFRATDMGCADGGTSVELWRSLFSHLRESYPDLPIEIIYADLPRNDFSQIFRMIHGQTEIKSYYNDIDNLYVYASGTSFHQAILPPDTLNLGFSATASHYISANPCHITNHVHMVGAIGEERTAFEEQGAKDWETMLLCRTKELKPGGRLALFNFGIDEENRYLGHTGGISMFDTFNEIFSELARDAVITDFEYIATNFPQCYRTAAQFTAPLNDHKNPVFKAGLRLEHIESRVVRCPFERDFTENHKDPELFAREYIPTLRSWSEATFLGGLSKDRSIDAKMKIMDTFYGRYHDRVASSPVGHAMDYVHIYLICSKIC